MRHGFKVETSGKDVFSEIAGPQLVAVRTENVEKLRRNKMDLAQVWQRWTMPCQITMSYEVASMCVPFDAKTFQKDDAVPGLLAEFVLAVAGEASDPAHGGYHVSRLQDGLIGGHAFPHRPYVTVSDAALEGEHFTRPWV